MERTKEQWQAIGRVLAHGICPGCRVQSALTRCNGDVGPIEGWSVGGAGVYTAMGHRCLWDSETNKFATVIDPPASLSGKEVSVTIDGQTYTAIIK